MSRPSPKIPSRVKRVIKDLSRATFSDLGHDPNSRWLSIAKASIYLGVSVQTIRNVIRRGDLKASDLGPSGGSYLIDKCDIDKLLERRKRTLPPYRRGSRPWVAKRWAAARRKKARA